jgi:hypothetical protein
MTAIPFDVELTQQLIAEQVADYPYGKRPVPTLTFVDELPDGVPIRAEWFFPFMEMDSTDLEERLPAYVSSCISNGIGTLALDGDTESSNGMLKIADGSVKLGLTKQDSMTVYITPPTVTDCGQQQDGPQAGKNKVLFVSAVKVEHTKV